MKKLLIGVDPGFDSIKVVMENTFFKMPFNAVQVDADKIIQHRATDSLIVYKNLRGKTYLIGDYARQFIYEFKNREEMLKEMESFYTIERFTKPEFKVVVQTAIHLAIQKHMDETNEYDLGEYEIVVNVALPHRHVGDYRGVILDALAGEHQFDLKLGNGEYEKVSYSIKKKNIGTISQTLSALIAVTTDDDCMESDEFEDILNGPSLVVDGGFYTVGLVDINEGVVLSNESTDSNTKYAMKNVYEKIEQSLKDKRAEIKSFNIEYLLKKNKEIKYRDKDGGVTTLDLEDLKKDKIKEQVGEFIEFLNKKYNDLFDIKYLIVTGGTGASYYESLKSYYVGSGILAEDRVVLTKGTLSEREWDTEFAISVGAYKSAKVALHK